jgi:hypothetical protein
LGILKQKAKILLKFDLNTTLAEINGIARDIDSELLIKDAVRLCNSTPESFISNDFAPDADEDSEILKSNEYFAQRWWELRRLEHDPKIQLFLLPVHDLQQHDKKLIIDTRPFTEYNTCHLKSSFHMSLLEEVSAITTYCKFIKAYQTAYPDNLIVLVGDQSDSSLQLGLLLLMEVSASRLCLLKGGIDAARLDCPTLLRKGSAN